MSRTHAPLVARSGVALALLAAVLLLPTIAVPLVHAAGSQRHSISIHEGMFGSSMRADLDTPDGRLEVEIDGKLKFNDAETDVVSLEDEATFSQTRDGVEHELELRAGSGGSIERRYRVDGDDRPYDAEAQRWFAALIPVVMRETGWDAEGRVERLKARGGAALVLEEIEKIQGNYARRSYVEALAEAGALAPAELDRLLAATVAIESDFERRTALQATIEHQQLGAAQQVIVLRGVASMGSDFEKRTVLESLGEGLDAGAEVRSAWAEAIATIGSDFEARTAIEALAERDTLDEVWLRAVLAAAGRIGSDFECRTALGYLVPHLERVPAVAPDYIAAVAGIGSDFERRTALVELVSEVELDAAGYAAVLDAVAEMDSDFESRTVLVEVAAHMPANADLIKRYRQVARGLSNFERGEAERALDHLEV